MVGNRRWQLTQAFLRRASCAASLPVQRPCRDARSILLLFCPRSTIVCGTKRAAWTICLSLGLGCCAAPIYGDDPPKDTKADAALGQLIDALANHNHAPKLVGLTGRDAPVFGESYKWDEEARVHQAFKELWKRNSGELWPNLMSHADDSRYAFTWLDDEDEIVLTESVGSLCKRIAHDDMTWPYMMFIPGYGGDFNAAPYHRLEYPKELEDLKAWYRKRAGKPLYELQIEMCQWAIATTRSSTDVGEKPKARFIQQVDGQIQELAKTKKPFVRERWHSEIYRWYIADPAKKH